MSTGWTVHALNDVLKKPETCTKGITDRDAKVMFSQASVILFNSGVCVSQQALGPSGVYPSMHLGRGRVWEQGGELIEDGVNKGCTPHLWDGHCHSQYASYWNSFLFHLCIPVMCTGKLRNIVTTMVG